MPTYPQAYNISLLTIYPLSICISLSLNLLSAYPYIYPSIYLSPCYLYIPNPCICLSADTHPIRTCNSLYRSYPHTLIPLTLTPLIGACLRSVRLYIRSVCWHGLLCLDILGRLDGWTLGRSDARTHSGSLSHPMYSDGINCARLRRYGGLSHTPAVYHACGWLWRAVAATMLAVVVIVACACVQSVRCYDAVRWCPVCYARRCSAPAILAAGVVDACALLCLYPAAVSVIGASAPGARTPCARTIGSIAPSGIGSSVGQLSAVCRPSVGGLAGLRRSG